MRIHTDEEQTLEPCKIHLAAEKLMDYVFWGRQEGRNLELARKLIESGVPITAVYNRTGVAQSKLSAMSKEAKLAKGEMIRTKGPLTKEQVRRVFLAEGMNIDIAKREGLSTGAVGRIKRRQSYEEYTDDLKQPGEVEG